MHAPTFEDIKAAKRRIASYAVKTPVIESDYLNEIVGARVLIKAENLQRTGSFKFRGACNFVMQMTDEECERGIVAYSSGNHAQGVAAAAATRGVKATIIMPSDAPQLKLDNTKKLGGKIVTYDRATQNREAFAESYMEGRSEILIPPFEHPRIIAGQGTAALELFTTASERGVGLASFLVPASGGGLIAGCGMAAKSLSPGTAVYGVEPEKFDDTKRSLAAGKPVENEQTTGSICDALLTQRPGDLTFSINARQLSGIELVSDDEVLAAMKFAYERLKLVVEPGGAVALAALLAGRFNCNEQPTGIILSGGNCDPDVFRSALALPTLGV